MQEVLRAVREERVRHELRAVRAPVGRVRRGLGDEHGVFLGFAATASRSLRLVRLQSSLRCVHAVGRWMPLRRVCLEDAVSDSFGFEAQRMPQTSFKMP